MVLTAATMSSPVGVLTLVASDTGLRAVLWENDDPSRVKLEIARRIDLDDEIHDVLSTTRFQLRCFFDDPSTSFSVPLEFVGTDFQCAVWQALRAIPVGETRSYGELAKQLAPQLGRQTAARAVGAANGRNPISIIAPCHRVIGGSGALTGFAGGLDAKAWLLKHEGAVLSSSVARSSSTTSVASQRSLFD